MVNIGKLGNFATIILIVGIVGAIGLTVLGNMSDTFQTTSTTTVTDERDNTAEPDYSTNVDYSYDSFEDGNSNGWTAAQPPTSNTIEFNGVASNNSFHGTYSYQVDGNGTTQDQASLGLVSPNSANKTGETDEDYGAETRIYLEENSNGEKPLNAVVGVAKDENYPSESIQFQVRPFLNQVAIGVTNSSGGFENLAIKSVSGDLTGHWFRQEVTVSGSRIRGKLYNETSNNHVIQVDASISDSNKVTSGGFVDTILFSGFGSPSNEPTTLYWDNVSENVSSYSVTEQPTSYNLDNQIDTLNEIAIKEDAKTGNPVTTKTLSGASYELDKENQLINVFLTPETREFQESADEFSTDYEYSSTSTGVASQGINDSTSAIQELTGFLPILGLIIAASVVVMVVNKRFGRKGRTGRA